jgi:hypothetical protein
MLGKTEGHSKMDNPDKLETLGTQDTGPHVLFMLFVLVMHSDVQHVLTI